MMDVIKLAYFGIFTLNQCAISRTVFINGHITNDAEYSLELSQSLFGRFGTWELLVIERHRSIWVRDGNQRLVEAPFGDGARCTRLTDQREIVHRFAINPLEGGNRIRTDALL